LPLIWGVSLTITDTVLMLYLMNKGMRKLEGFIISMIFIIGVSFLVEMFIVGPDVDIAKGFIPATFLKTTRQAANAIHSHRYHRRYGNAA
jgi:manganese transport protein